MPPSTAPAHVYATEEDLDALLSEAGTDNRVDDDANSAPASLEAGYLTKALYWATARVNMYALGRYAASDLANSWVVNNWCVVLACHWLSCRRGNPPPGSFDQLKDEVMEDLKAIRAGEADLPEIGLRNAAWPAWSNVRVDCLYRLRKIRVEKPISEKTAQRGPFLQHRDIGADITIEPG